MFSHGIVVSKLCFDPQLCGHLCPHTTFEDKLCSAHHFGWVHSSAVAAFGIDGEGGMLADGVWVVVVVALPRVVVVMEDEVPREEEDLRPHLTALAHPLAMQPDGQVCLGGQDGWVVLIWAVDDSARNARAVMVLKESRQELSWGAICKQGQITRAFVSSCFKQERNYEINSHI